MIIFALKFVNLWKFGNAFFSTLCENFRITIFHNKKLKKVVANVKTTTKKLNFDDLKRTFSNTKCEEVQRFMDTSIRTIFS